MWIPAPASCAHLSDKQIETAIAGGTSRPFSKIWKDVEKEHEVRVNRAGIGDTVGKTLFFLTPSAAISLEAAERKRRHQSFTVEEAKQNHSDETVQVLLKVEATGMYAMNVVKWQAPAVHMTLTLDGNELQPVREATHSETSRQVLGEQQHGILHSDGSGNISYTPTYTTAIYDMTHSSTWFRFAVPEDVKKASVTVISSDGHEKHKEFDPAILR